MFHNGLQIYKDYINSIVGEGTIVEPNTIVKGNLKL